MSEIIAEPALFGTKLTESDTFELNFNPSPTNKQTNKINLASQYIQRAHVANLSWYTGS